LASVASAMALQPEQLPKLDKKEDAPDSNPALSEMLRVLLKAKTEHLGVAAKLIASAYDLDAMAAGERNLDMLRGWRAEVFGNDAKRLCQGEIGLVAKGRIVTTFEIPN
jgi:ribonuclease D